MPPLLIVGLALLAATALRGAAPRAQGVDLGRGPVLLIADEVEYDAEAQVVTASGNVEVLRGKRRLLADRLRYDQRAGEIRAIGDVTLLEPTGEAIFADEMTLAEDLESGVVEQLRVRLTDDSLFAAAEARLIDGTRTELDKGVYSPCPVCKGGSPLWQIRASEIVHDQVAKEISYKHAFLEFGGVPVLYTPYFFHPDPSVERKSGFLSPSFGNDSDLGAMISIPYFYALADNYDLTMTPIFMTQENPALVLEYRHLLENGRFELAASGTYATEAGSDDDPNPDGKDFRGHIEGDGRFDLGNRWKGGFDLAAATDDTYLQRYGFSNANVLRNRLFAERVWDRNFAMISGYGFQGLREQDEQDEIPIVLPRGELKYSIPWRWGSRFNLDGSMLATTRVHGLDTRRLSTTAGWEVPWQGSLGDRARLQLDLRGDVYQTDGNPETLGRGGGNNLTGRLFPRASAVWSWPWVAEAFGYMPLLEPTVSATYAPTGINDDDIPNEDSLDFEFDDTSLFEANRFPGLDRVEEGTRINYGLRFATYGDSTLLSGLVGQSFRINKDSDLPARSGLDDRLSDFVGRVDFTPHKWLGVRYRFGLDQKDLKFLRHELEADFGPRAARFSVDYLFLADDPALNRERKREEITAGVSLRLTRSITLRARTRYNLQADENIFHKLGLVYTNPCLQFVAGIQRRNTSNRDAGSSTTFMFRVSLRNLGELEADSRMLGPLTGP